jgi:hypothetical protein
MASNNKQVDSQHIASYAKEHFGELNKLQKFVTGELISQTKTNDLAFTRAAINYLLKEIDDPKISREISDLNAKEVLNQLLEVANEHSKRRVELTSLVSFAAITRALKVFPCPKPWC